MEKFKFALDSIHFRKMERKLRQLQRKEELGSYRWRKLTKIHAAFWRTWVTYSEMKMKNLRQLEEELVQEDKHQRRTRKFRKKIAEIKARIEARNR